VPLPELHLHRDLVIRASWFKAGIVELPVIVAEALRLRTSHDPAHGADPHRVPKRAIRAGMGPLIPCENAL
jgi:hypothetical protein